MNALFKVLLILFTALMLQSCSSYIQFFAIKKAPNEQAMQSRVFELPSDTLTMQFFGDYCFEKGKDEVIIVSNSKVRKILPEKFSLKSSTQIAFAYTDLPEHYNVFVFYYPKKTIEKVREEHKGNLYKQQFNSLLYVYENMNFVITDVFREVEGGSLRFVSIYKPTNEKSKSAFIDFEIYELYFNRN
jgi:hypothetical protein